MTVSSNTPLTTINLAHVSSMFDLIHMRCVDVLSLKHTSISQQGGECGQRCPVGFQYSADVAGSNPAVDILTFSF